MIFDDSVTKLNGSVAFTNAKGNPARVDGIPVWAIGGDPIGTVTASDDGMSASVDLNGTLGTAQISVTADADLGAGVRSLVVLGDLQIVAGEAIAGSINFTAA